jgi:hypothetical protein
MGDVQAMRRPLIMRLSNIGRAANYTTLEKAPTAEM